MCIRDRVTDQETIPVAFVPKENKMYEHSVFGQLKIPFTIKQHAGFKGIDKKVKCLGHSTLSKFKDVTFAKNKDEGTLDLNLNTYKLPVGEHVLYLRTQVKGKYSRVPKARIDAAKEEQKKADAAAAVAPDITALHPVGGAALYPDAIVAGIRDAAAGDEAAGTALDCDCVTASRRELEVAQDDVAGTSEGDERTLEQRQRDLGAPQGFGWPQVEDTGGAVDEVLARRGRPRLQHEARRSRSLLQPHTPAPTPAARRRHY